MMIGKTVVRSLAQWLQDYLEDRWDRQIEADLASGKLVHKASALPNRLMAKAEAGIDYKNIKKL